MGDIARDAARVLEIAQSGAPREALATVDAMLARYDEPQAALYYGRAVALHVLSDHLGSLQDCDRALVAADRAGDAGWRSAALSFRAVQRLYAGEEGTATYDVDAILHDLALAEVALDEGIDDPYVRSTAHTGLGFTYHMLRLYELARPHYLRAYDATMLDPDRVPETMAMYGTNLAELELQWGFELYRVGETDEANLHNLEAERHALRAIEEAAGGQRDRWHDGAQLMLGCARASGSDPAGGVAQIEQYLKRVRGLGLTDQVTFALPFLAFALDRSGRVEEALTVAEEAVGSLQPDTDWLVIAAARHTLAMIHARQGGRGAEAGLAYGDTLSVALWRQRLRTLRAAETMVAYEKLQADRDRIARDSDSDPLTGIGNRRAFDRAVGDLEARREADGTSASVVLVDLDKFKSVNDGYGHAHGDDVLRAVASAMARHAREGDLVARLGGDEFVALLPDAGAGAARRVADRMLAAVRDVSWAELGETRPTVSIGVASSSPVRSVPDTVAAADTAMYRVKRAGGNGVAGPV
jgi:diguanylate cyclase (GGDEF)-like protein